MVSPKIRPHFRCVVLSVAAGSMPTAAFSQEAGQCEQITTFSKSVRASLESLKDASIGVNRWAARSPAFIGASDCTVEGDEQLRCADAWDANGKETATRADGSAKAIARCLGSEWQSSGRRISDNRAITFTWNPQTQVEFQVALESRSVPVQRGASGASTLLGEEPDARLEWRRTFLLTVPNTSSTAAQMSWQSDEARLCSDLRAVVASGVEEFTSMKLVQTGEFEWDSKVSLYGFRSCDITRLTSKTIYYSCSSEPLESVSKVLAGQTALESTILTCLGKSWSSAKRPRGDGLWTAVLAEPGENVSVELRGRRSSRGNMLIVIDVNAERQ